MRRLPRQLSVLYLATLVSIAACTDSTGPGSPSELAFAVGPSSTTVGAALAPPVAVAVRDADGNTVADWSHDITLTLEGGPPGATLNGTTRQTPLAGLAIFDGLRIQDAGQGYRLVAHSGDLVEVLSEPFDTHRIFRPVAITSGDEHTCALDAEGTAYCWGLNAYGQLGTGDTRDRSMPTAVSSDIRFASLIAYGDHTCGLSLVGDVYCWGLNSTGQSGGGTTENRLRPGPVSLPAPVAILDVGWYHACALLEDGRAFCWGDNSGGALGIGVADSLRTSPVQVIGDHDWVKIETGYMQTCGLTTDGEAYCWGPNVYGENGTGEIQDPRVGPTTPVLGDHRFADLVAGGGPCHGETCGITTDGQVLCWGRRYQPTTGAIRERYGGVPIPIVGDPGLVEVIPGPLLVCGFTADHEPYCLGDPVYWTFPDTEAPVRLLPDMDIASLALGNSQACVIMVAGEAYCWGSNSRGQLGSGDGSLGWQLDDLRGVWAPDGG
jgi:alpha-tubulin suppressor-like RCC1 family protein